MVAVTCLAVQIASATFGRQTFDTPNASTAIARHLVERGEYAVRAWYRPLDAGPADAHLLRAFQLPGEPLYLAAGLALIPAPLQRYLHVPIAVLFVTAVAAVALIVAGRRGALVAGLLATLDPFVIRHGPVWDDTFLAAALEWTVVALLVRRLAATPATSGAVRRWLWPTVLAVCAGCAALTRLQAQLVLAAMALVAMTQRRFRAVRMAGVAVLVGIGVALAGWGGRNAAVTGHFTIGTSHDGQALWRSIPQGPRWSRLEAGASLARTPSGVPEDLGEFEADRHFRDEALTYLRTHPVDAAEAATTKAALSMLGIAPDQPWTSARNAVAAGSNILLLVLGVAGWSRWRQGPAARTAAGRFTAAAAAAAGAVTLAMLLAGPVGLRYRLDLAALAYIGGALAVITAPRSRPGTAGWRPGRCEPVRAAAAAKACRDPGGDPPAE